MSRYRIGLAGHAEDAAIRTLTSQTPMKGRISVTFRREPDYFAASAVEGRFRQVVVGYAEPDHLCGMGTRSIDRRMVNGRPEAIGYLSGLRILPEHRNGVLLARGLQFLRELHSDGRASLYLTTIADDNELALRTFLSRHRFLPDLQPLGRFHTLALTPTPTRRTPEKRDGTSVRRATPEDVPLMLDFLRQEGPRRQFFPEYDDSDFALEGRLRGLNPEDVHLAFRQDRLVGMLGGWDQNEFRQTVLQNYSPSLRFARPLYNMLAWVQGVPKLPRAGTQIRSVFAALPVIVQDDGEVLLRLLDAVRQDAATRRADCAFIGFHERDPLWKIVRHLRGMVYTTRLFLVYWKDGEAVAARIDDRIPYLELGSL